MSELLWKTPIKWSGNHDLIGFDTQFQCKFINKGNLGHLESLEQQNANLQFLEFIMLIEKPILFPLFFSFIHMLPIPAFKTTLDSRSINLVPLRRIYQKSTVPDYYILMWFMTGHISPDMLEECVCVWERERERERRGVLISSNKR